MTKKKFRKFTDDEKKATKKILDSRIVELEHLKLMVEYNTFMLDKMLYSNYLEKRRGFRRQTMEYENEIADLEQTIKITGEQITKGVEIQEESNDIPAMVS